MFSELIVAYRTAYNKGNKGVGGLVTAGKKPSLAEQQTYRVGRGM